MKEAVHLCGHLKPLTDGIQVSKAPFLLSEMKMFFLTFFLVLNFLLDWLYIYIKHISTVDQS